jgi:hypothetical protein
MVRWVLLCLLVACSPPGSGGDALPDASLVRSCEVDDDCEVAPWLCPRCVEGACSAVECAADAGVDAGEADAGDEADAGEVDAGEAVDAGRDCGDTSEERWCGRGETRPRCGPITGRDDCGNDLAFDCGDCPPGEYPRCSASGLCY